MMMMMMTVWFWNLSWQSEPPLPLSLVANATLALQFCQPIPLTHTVGYVKSLYILIYPSYCTFLQSIDRKKAVEVLDTIPGDRGAKRDRGACPFPLVYVNMKMDKFNSIVNWWLSSLLIFILSHIFHIPVFEMNWHSITFIFE